MSRKSKKMADMKAGANGNGSMKKGSRYKKGGRQSFGARMAALRGKKKGKK